MTDQEQKEEPTTITSQPDAENKKEVSELSEEELKKATGGVTFDFPPPPLITSIQVSGSNGEPVSKP